MPRLARPPYLSKVALSYKPYGFKPSIWTAMNLTRFRINLALVTMMLVAGASSAHAASTSSSVMSEAWWHERFVQKQAELRKHPVHLVFLGDSIFHSFEWDPHDPVWDHWYGRREAVNLGFNGDITDNVIWRVRHGELDGLALKLAVILIGANDFGKPASDIAEGIKTLAQTVKQAAPSSKVLVLGILPNGRPDNDQKKRNEINARLTALFGRPNATAAYQDVSCVFYHRGQLDAGLFREQGASDGKYLLHPTPQGMDLIAGAIEPMVATALGDQKRTPAGNMRETDCSTGG